MSLICSALKADFLGSESDFVHGIGLQSQHYYKAFFASGQLKYVCHSSEYLRVEVKGLSKEMRLRNFFFRKIVKRSPRPDTKYKEISFVTLEGNKLSTQ